MIWKLQKGEKLKKNSGMISEYNKGRRDWEMIRKHINQITRKEKKRKEISLNWGIQIYSWSGKIEMKYKLLTPNHLYQLNNKIWNTEVHSYVYLL